MPDFLDLLLKFFHLILSHASPAVRAYFIKPVALGVIFLSILPTRDNAAQGPGHPGNKSPSVAESGLNVIGVDQVVIMVVPARLGVLVAELWANEEAWQCQISQDKAP